MSLVLSSENLSRSATFRDGASFLLSIVFALEGAASPHIGIQAKCGSSKQQRDLTYLKRVAFDTPSPGTLPDCSCCNYRHKFETQARIPKAFCAYKGAGCHSSSSRKRKGRGYLQKRYFEQPSQTQQHIH